MSIEQVTIDAGGTPSLVDVKQGPAGPSFFGKEFISTEQAVPASATLVELTHDLGAVPKSFQWVARCKSAENGYAVGDEIDVTTNSHTSGRLSIFASSRKVSFIYHTKLTFADKDAGGTWDFTNADTNWKLVCRAYA